MGAKVVTKGRDANLPPMEPSLFHEKAIENALFSMISLWIFAPSKSFDRWKASCP